MVHDMHSRIHGSSHATHRMGGLFRMEAGETRTGIWLHDPLSRLRAPLEPQRRQAGNSTRRFQHWTGLVSKSARPFSPHDPYSLRGLTSCRVPERTAWASTVPLARWTRPYRPRLHNTASPPRQKSAGGTALGQKKVVAWHTTSQKKVVAWHTTSQTQVVPWHTTAAGSTT